MDGFESNRRDFLKKLGLIAGATAVATSGISAIPQLINDKKDEIQLTPEQTKFMVMYEKWLDEFHDMAKFQRNDPDHLGNNLKLMKLSDAAKVWQKELIEHMKDENFARYYMLKTQKVTESI